MNWFWDIVNKNKVHRYKSQLAGGRLAGYLQARPRSWTWGYRETTPASGQSGTWARDHRISSPVP